MKKMGEKTRQQETRDFLASYSLFMPSNPVAREAIRSFIHSGNKYRLGGATPSDRAAALRTATEELRGRLVTHRKPVGEHGLLRVLYVLPKTEREIEKQLIDRANDRHGVLEKRPIHPFKVCVEGGFTSKSRVIPLDMLVLVDEEAIL